MYPIWTSPFPGAPPPRNPNLDHHAGAEAIVTRDPKGFATARLKLYAPDELLRFLTAAPES